MASAFPGGRTCFIWFEFTLYIVLNPVVQRAGPRFERGPYLATELHHNPISSVKPQMSYAAPHIAPLSFSEANSVLLPPLQLAFDQMFSDDISFPLVLDGLPETGGEGGGGRYITCARAGGPARLIRPARVRETG